MMRVTSILCVCLVGVFAVQCSEKSSIYGKGDFGLNSYNKEQIINNLSIAPVQINAGKPFTKAGIIELFLIEGSPQYTAGKKNVICRIYQFGEVDQEFKFDIEGPECCVTKIDDHTFDLRPANSLFTYRLSFDPTSGTASIRMLSGSAQFVTIRYAVQQFW
jgi:hypothetical protein